MSRIGKKPIEVPQGVTLEQKGDIVVTNGPKGELSLKLPEGFSIRQRDSLVYVDRPPKESPNIAALFGLTRSLLANCVRGVTDGFTKKLVIEGVGYRAEVKGKELILHVGFSHPIHVSGGEDIEFSVNKNIITVSGINKYNVGEVAARIRSYRKPEPYKGKGIRHEGEHVRRKGGKKAAVAA